MTTPVKPEQDPLARLMALKQQREQVDPLEELRRRKAQRLHDEYKTGNLARRMATNNAQEAAELEETGVLPAFARSFMATSANLSHGIPGMKAVQAFLRSKARGQTYREALADIEGETEKIPEPLRNIEKAVGAAPAALALPASTLTKAAVGAGALGWAHEMGNADPDVSLEERNARAPIAAGVGAGLTTVVGGGAKAIDKGVQLGRLAKRVKDAPTVGADAVATDKAITKATRENYGASAAEAEAGGGTSPGVQEALKRPRSQKFVDAARDAQPDASDYEIAHDVAKRISDVRRGLQASQKKKYDEDTADRIVSLGRELKAFRKAIESPSKRPAITLDVAAEITETAPQRIPGRENIFGLPTHTDVPGVRVETPGMRVQTAPAEEVPALAPSYTRAYTEKARMEREREAGQEAAEMASRIARGLRTNPKTAATKSPEAYREKIPDMPQNEAAAAVRAFLAGVKPELGYRPQQGVIRSIAELGRPAKTLNRVGPYVDALDRTAGNATREPMDVESLRRLMPAIQQQLLEYLLNQRPAAR